MTLSQWFRTWWPFQPAVAPGDADPPLPDDALADVWAEVMREASRLQLPLPGSKEELAAGIAALDAYLDTRLAEVDTAENAGTLDDWYTTNRTALKAALPANVRTVGAPVLKIALRAVRRKRRELAALNG